MHPRLLTRTLQGEAREVAVCSWPCSTRSPGAARPSAGRRVSIAGGETTVTIRGRGKGGRCQEFALALVPELAAMRDVVVLAAGTDGSDGPTDAAGAVVDPTSFDRARGLGLDARRALAENDSYPFFGALGDLVVTGPTGSNLMDLYVGLVG